MATLSVAYCTARRQCTLSNGGSCALIANSQVKPLYGLSAWARKFRVGGDLLQRLRLDADAREVDVRAAVEESLVHGLRVHAEVGHDAVRQGLAHQVARWIPVGVADQL